MFSAILSIITILVMIISIIWFPKITIKKFSFQSFWVVSLIGAILIILFGNISFAILKDVLFGNDKINPFEILILFISMSFISIVLDHAGFFKLCAYFACKLAKKKQITLFLSLSVVVSILTVFTSNDIVILTFTPFICYFSKHAKINPIPYLLAEYIFANTWSMLFIIGNPTNIFLSSSFGIKFLDYLKVMWAPTLVSGISASIILYILFKKDLKKDIELTDVNYLPHTDMLINIVGVIHLSICTILLVISSYLNLKMWIISFACAMSLLIFLIIYKLVTHSTVLKESITSCPYNLIPFVLSMYIIVSSIDKSGILPNIAKFFNTLCTNKAMDIYSYGFLSFISCNFVNNIPMSVMFQTIISESNQVYLTESIYSTIISSNIGAYLTPIGALAGIMWMSILNEQGINFRFKDFIKKASLISIIIIFISLSTLLMFC